MISKACDRFPLLRTTKVVGPALSDAGVSVNDVSLKVTSTRVSTALRATPPRAALARPSVTTAATVATHATERELPPNRPFLDVFRFATRVGPVRGAARSAAAGGVVRSLLLGAALLVAVGVVAAFVPTARASSGTTPELYVTFAADGSASITLSDGTPVGTASGAPTVIAAGYYTVLMSGPEGCSESLYVDIEGPGVDLVGSLDNGEVATATYTVDFLPNSTYTWRTEGFPDEVYAFTTSSTISSASPPSSTAVQPAGASSSSQELVGQDVVGSATSTVPFRGTLIGTVSPSGRVTLTFGGKVLGRVVAGSYRVTVTDESRVSGFVLIERHQLPDPITGARYLGRRSVIVDLSPGAWFVAPRFPGPTSAFTVVG